MVYEEDYVECKEVEWCRWRKSFTETEDEKPELEIRALIWENNSENGVGLLNIRQFGG